MSSSIREPADLTSHCRPIRNLYSLARISYYTHLTLHILEFHLFWSLQNSINERNFNSLETCKKHLDTSITQKDAKFWEDGMETWSCLKDSRTRWHIYVWINIYIQTFKYCLWNSLEKNSTNLCFNQIVTKTIQKKEFNSLTLNKSP